MANFIPAPMSTLLAEDVASVPIASGSYTWLGSPANPLTQTLAIAGILTTDQVIVTTRVIGNASTTADTYVLTANILTDGVITFTLNKPDAEPSGVYAFEVKRQPLL